MLLCGVQNLDKFFEDNSTLPIYDSETIVDIFKYCINKNANFLKQSNIEISATNSTTNRHATDVVDLILSPAEIQMNNWKPGVTNIMQLFQDFDNKGFDASKSFLISYKTPNLASHDAK